MRIANRLIATVLGLVLAAAAVLVTVEVIRSRTGSGPWLLDTTTVADAVDGQKWSSTPVRAILVGVGVLGLLLLIAELRPRRRRFLPLADAHDGVTPVVPVKAMERSVRSVATSTEGVHDADAHITRRRARVVVRTALREPGDLRTRVEERVRQRIAEVRPARMPRVSVRVRPGAAS